MVKSWINRMIKEIIKKYSNDIRHYLLWTAAFYLVDLVLTLLIIHVLVHILPDPPCIRVKMLYATSLIIYFLIYRYSQKKGVDIAENILCEVRETIIENIRKCDLQSFEKIDKSGGYNAITLETQILSEGIQKFQHLIEEFNYTLTAGIVILIISPISFWFIIGIISCAASIYSYYILKAKKLIHEARKKEKELFAASHDVISGFKSLKLNDQKNDDFYHQSLKLKSADNRRIRIKAENLLIQSNVYSIMFEFSIYLPIVFILPYMKLISTDIMIALMTLVLLISFGIIRNTIPFIVRIGVSIERLILLEQTLKKVPEDKLINVPTQRIKSFKEIQYDNIGFNYSNNSDFSTFFFLEDISFSIYPEEIIFISGGNGSGKSTLLKVITGLYDSSSGSTYINGKEVDITQYRYLFSAIFTDFHLFDRLYGFKHDIDQKKLKDLLKIMDLDQKLSYEDNRFSTLDLSSGQKKRLAMIVSLLEDKPIYIFDEWAADQMPQFREYFYHQLLPDLRHNGKCVIAVTHDDDYYHTADRMLQMDFGCLKQMR